MGKWSGRGGGVLCFLFLAWLLLPAAASSQASHKDELAYPRLANYFLHGFVDESRIDELAKWDVVILNTVWTAEQLEQLRQFNPDIKIYLYICPYCVPAPANPNNAFEFELFRYARDYDLWWYDTQSRVASDWPGSKMINVIRDDIRGPLGTWHDLLVLKIGDMIQNLNIDGIFLDNFWERISWAQEHLQLDSDCHPMYSPSGCDGAADSPEELDRRWNASLRKLASQLRDRFDALNLNRKRPLALITNSSSDYFELLNGTLLELFPFNGPADYGNPHQYAWQERMFGEPAGYLVAPFSPLPYKLMVVNASWSGTVDEPHRTAGFERHKRFNFASTLLGDGYFSLDTGSAGHGNYWWEPEYDHDGRQTGYLGMPLTRPKRSIGENANGPEFILNPGFETGETPWKQSVAGSGDVSLDLTQGFSGSASMRLIGTEGIESAKIWQTGLQLIKDRGYTLRCYAKSFVEPQEVRLELASTDCHSENCMRPWRLKLDSGWKRFDISFIAPATTSASLNVLLSEPGVAWVDDFSLKEGNRNVFQRAFQKGLVIVNYTPDTQYVNLPGSLQRLDIAGSDVFDGRIIEVETVPPWDARILVNPWGVSPVNQESSREITGYGLRMLPAGGAIRLAMQYRLPAPGRLSVNLYDVRGRLVRRLWNGASTGYGTLTWDGRTSRGGRAAAGVFFVRLLSGSVSEQRKVVFQAE